MAMTQLTETAPPPRAAEAMSLHDDVEEILLDYASELLLFVDHSGELGARVGATAGRR